MKKTIQILFVSVLLLFISSCSNEDNNNEEKLLKRLIEVNQDGSSSTTNFTYNGNQIVSVVSETKSESFTYTGDLITKITSKDIPNNKQTTFDYIYTDAKLTKVISSDNYVLNFVHNENGTVSYEKVIIGVNNNKILVYHGTLSFQGQNAKEDKRVLDNTPANMLSKEEVSFVYDAKKNPLHNIKGYSKLLDLFATISANNAVSRNVIHLNIYLDTNQATSSVVSNPRDYKYDTSGYPTEVVSDIPVFGNDNPKHLKSLYFYE
ncbi:MAG TPA: hypothetical protein VN182_08740 [Flavobacterium sp.]|nr:hypothetical protein [Flavobacterium sp.]